MRKDIPLHQYPKDVQIATHMIGLNYKFDTVSKKFTAGTFAGKYDTPVA